MYGELKFYKNKMKQMPGSQQETAKSALFLESLIYFQSQSLQEKGKLSAEENTNDSEVPSSSGIDSTKSQDKDANEGMLRSFATCNKC